MILTLKKNHTYGEVAKALTSLNEKEHPNFKAKKHLEVKLRSFTQEGISVTIIDAPVIENNCLKISLHASKDGNQLFIDNPVYFHNPPVMIPDGTMYEAKDQQGNEVYLHNYKEDVEGAFKVMIIKLIKQMNNLS